MLRNKRLFRDLVVTKTKLLAIRKLVKNKENISTLWLPAGGKTTFGYAIQNMPILSSIIPFRGVSGVVFIYIDLNIDKLQIDKYLNERLAGYSAEEGITGKIESIIKHNYLYFVLDNLTKENYKNIQYITLYSNLSNSRIKFLNLFNIEEYLSLVKDNKSLPFDIFHNTILMPYLTYDLFKEWIYYKRKKLKVPKRKVNLQEIYSYCGGVPLLIKNTLRGLKNYSSVKEVFESFEMSNIVNLFWRNFSNKEKQIIISAFKGKGLPPYKEEIYYLKKLNLLNENGRFNKKWLYYINNS